MYFEEAMLCDVNNVNTPKYYIKCLLDNEDLDEAEKLSEYALKIKGIDKCRILIQKSYLFEIKMDFKSDLETLKEAKNFAYDQQMLDFLKSKEKSIKEKMQKKPRGKSNKKKETN